MDYKLILSLLSVPLTIFLFLPYIRDVLKGKTTPHAYTWLIWSITMVIAILGAYQSGSGGLIFVTLGIPTLFVMMTFALSLKFGSKDINLFDTGILLLAILSVILYIFNNNPLFAVILVSVADGLGYIPTYRKSFHNPWSETLVFWGGGIVLNIFMIGSLDAYNVTTLLYILTIMSANLILFVGLVSRRRYLTKKQGNKFQNQNL